MSFNPNSKLSRVREAMAESDWETAIRLTAKMRDLGKYQVVIDRADNYLKNPTFYEQLGYSKDAVVAEAVEAIKSKYSRSWGEVRKNEED